MGRALQQATGNSGCYSTSRVKCSGDEPRCPPRICQTFAASPAEPGELPFGVRIPKDGNLILAVVWHASMHRLAEIGAARKRITGCFLRQIPRPFHACVFYCPLELAR